MTFDQKDVLCEILFCIKLKPILGVDQPYGIYKVWSKKVIAEFLYQSFGYPYPTQQQTKKH